MFRSISQNDGGDLKTKSIDKNLLAIPKGCTGIGFSFTEISCLENCVAITVQVLRHGRYKESSVSSSLSYFPRETSYSS